MSYFENTRNEDAAHASGDPGTQLLAVRKATPVNLSGTDGDYEPLQISAGRLWASVLIDTALPAGTALIGKVGIDQTTPGTTNAISITHLGANAIAVGNGASSTGVLRVAQVNDGTGVLATVSTVTNLSQLGGAAIAMGTGVRTAGTQRVTIATDDAVPMTDNAGSLTVDAPVGTPVFVQLSDGTDAIAILPVEISNATLPTYQSVNAIPVKDLTQYEGWSQIELLAQILLELQISNEYMSGLAKQIIDGIIPSFFTTTADYTRSRLNNEPREYRNEQSIFKN